MMDIDFWTDVTAWGVSMILYFIFMGIIWLMPTLGGSEWNPFHRIIVTILAVPVLYAVAKWRIDK